MKFKLVYISPNGTTKKTSEILKGVIKKSGHDVELLDLGDKINRENFIYVLDKIIDSDIVGFGSPAYHMDMLEPMKRFFEVMLTRKYTYHFKSFLYLNYAGITSGKAFLNTAKMFKNINVPIIGAIKVVAPHFHHDENYPTKNIEILAEELFHKMQMKNFEPMSWGKVFDKFSDQKLRVNLLYPIVHSIGKKRELNIIINPEKCISCGRCVKECPVGAINLNGSAKVNFTKCIHCYHCTVSCKLHAVEVPIEKIDKMIEMNKRIIGIEKTQNQIYV